jgi:signal-transduction protein with cAMP-binding, CBS, and nucleotidyltransferase domain
LYPHLSQPRALGQPELFPRIMKTSVIRHRVADFLKSHAPFDVLADEDLLELAGSGRVKFHESEEFVFEEGDGVGPVIWVIQQGRVELLESGHLRDVVGAGDLLGLDRFAGSATFRQSARTATDVILYAVDAGLFQSLLTRYGDVRRYLAAHFSLAETAGFGRTSWLDAPAPPATFLEARYGASFPVTTRSAVRGMLASGSERFEALTADDLALFCHRNPARLIREIRQGRSAAEIKPLADLATRLVLDGLAHASDVDDCSVIGTEVVAALADAAIRLASLGLEGLEQPALPSCWVTFGAAARRDLVRPLWPNIAAVYDDSELTCPPEASVYFTALNGETAGWLDAFGLRDSQAVWPEGTNPCMPLSEWKQFFSDTVSRPLEHELYLRREFFDLLPFSGDAAILGKLRAHILAELAEQDLLIPLLANDTMRHLPPLTFFGGLVVELDGGERPAFDVADTALTPIADAARVFALGARRLEVTHTLDRLAAGAADFPARAAVFEEAAEAFRITLYHQTLAGSPKIDPARLGRYDSRLLKTAFASIQRLLEFTMETFVPNV